MQQAAKVALLFVFLLQLTAIAVCGFFISLVIAADIFLYFTKRNLRLSHPFNK